MKQSTFRKVGKLLFLILVAIVMLSQAALAYQSRWKALKGIKSISIAAFISDYPEIKHPSQIELVDCMKKALGDIKIEPKKDGVPELVLFVRYCTDDRKKWLAYTTDLHLSKIVKTPNGFQEGTFWHDSDLASCEIDQAFNDNLLRHVESEVKEFVEEYKKANSNNPNP